MCRQRANNSGLRGGQVHDLGQREGRGDLDAVGPERGPAGHPRPVGPRRRPASRCTSAQARARSWASANRKVPEVASTAMPTILLPPGSSVVTLRSTRLGGRGPSLRVLLGEDLFVASRMGGNRPGRPPPRAPRSRSPVRGPRPCRRPTRLPTGVFRPQYGSPPRDFSRRHGSQDRGQKGIGDGVLRRCENLAYASGYDSTADHRNPKR